MQHPLSREEILSRIDVVLEQEGDERIAAGCDEVLRVLGAEDGVLEADERAFLTGYVGYLHPRTKSSEQARQEASQHLLQAHANASNSSLRGRAALYLGHLSYDVGDFSRAQAWFVRAQNEELGDYLGLKAREFETCCLIMSQGLGPSVEAFAEFVKRARNAVVQDLWPQELARVLSAKIAEPLSDDARSQIREGATVLDDVGDFGRWFGEIVDNASALQ